MHVHASKTSTESLKNGEKLGGNITAESVQAEAHQAAADGESRQTDPAKEESTQAVVWNTERLLAGAKRVLVPVGKWVQDRSAAHPYLTVASSMGAVVLAGALARRPVVVRMGLTMGILTAIYLRRQRKRADRASAGVHG